MQAFLLTEVPYSFNNILDIDTYYNQQGMLNSW
ncbi:MAG: hypothetical protein AMDU1_APLC00036G0006 [Thermoplasmatales archaeon A-plasma]|nr:MAG: hypothetical protein AMDU1_APLC00036G0006 [Thermoplasmatales archaeon A-plasma]